MQAGLTTTSATPTMKPSNEVPRIATNGMIFWRQRCRQLRTSRRRQGQKFRCELRHGAVSLAFRHPALAGLPLSSFGRRTAVRAAERVLGMTPFMSFGCRLRVEDYSMRLELRLPRLAQIYFNAAAPDAR